MMDDSDFRAGSGQITPQLRKHPRVRVSAPFPCSLARVGLLRKGAVEQGLGIIYDVSAKGARVMTEAVITPGDRIAMRLRLPDQAALMVIETATVRWGKEQTYGVEFEELSPNDNKHLQAFMNHQSRSGQSLAV
ncbi:MAG TPA: PilZ domain-containing protein [Nitrospira sp.]|nr:PilZ domain-containing protein [Nitrospira sp.]